MLHALVNFLNFRRFARAFFIAEMAEWSIATDCKSVALTGYEGSNPSLSTRTNKIKEVI